MSTLPETHLSATANLRLKEVRGEYAVLSVPGTDYELHLVCDGGLSAEPGKRIKGEVHAAALRMHRADAGGQFIEPVYGSPRIVQGIVQNVDIENNRVLMDMSIPVWITINPRDNDIAEFHPGDMWNCYVQSDTRFVPKH